MGDTRKKGFTLIEVVISIAILAIVIVPIATSLIVSTGTNKKSSDVINGTRLAEEQAEDIRNMLKPDNASLEIDLSQSSPPKAPDSKNWGEGFIPVRMDPGNVITDCDASLFYSHIGLKGSWGYRDKDGKYAVICSVENLGEGDDKNYNDSYVNKLNNEGNPYIVSPDSIPEDPNKKRVLIFKRSADGKILVIDNNGDLDTSNDTMFPVQSVSSAETKFTFYFMCGDALSGASDTAKGKVYVSVDPAISIDELNCVVINDFSGKVEINKDTGSEDSIKKLYRDDILDSRDSFAANKQKVRRYKTYKYRVEVFKIEKRGAQMLRSEKSLAAASSQRYISKSD